MYQSLALVFILGFSSGLPFALLGTTLQAWFSSSGSSFLLTGFLSLLGLPYVLRVLWAPILDRYALLSLGKRRAWIALMQLLLFFGFQGLAFFSPLHDLNELYFLLILLTFCSATQDVAIDAHRREYLPLSLHALGASAAIFGYRLALLVGSGVALLLAFYGGWPLAYQSMSFFMLPGMVAILLSKEPDHGPIKKETLWGAYWAPLKDFLSRPKFSFMLLFIIFFKCGDVFTGTASPVIMPFLIQGLGFSLDTVAYVNKLMGISATLLGSLAAGLFLFRYALFSALIFFGVLQAFSTALFLILAFMGKQELLFIVAVLCDNFTAGMGSIALMTLFMRIVNPAYTATQFSLLVAWALVPRIIVGPIAAIIHSFWDWKGVYLCAFILAWAFLPFVWRIRDQIEKGGSSEKKESHREEKEGDALTI